MKAMFTRGEGKVEVVFDFDSSVPEHLKSKQPKGLRTTVLTITLPGSEPLVSKVACHTGDQFCKRVGRHHAFLKLIDADNEQARDKAVEVYQESELIKKAETNEGLRAAARKFYKISREDRKVIFKITCPEYFSHTPERRAIREKAMFERLKAKYADGKTISINQSAGDVSGTMIGAVIEMAARRKAAK